MHFFMEVNSTFNTLGTLRVPCMCSQQRLTIPSHSWLVQLLKLETISTHKSCWYQGVGFTACFCRNSFVFTYYISFWCILPQKTYLLQQPSENIFRILSFHLAVRIMYTENIHEMLPDDGHGRPQQCNALIIWLSRAAKFLFLISHNLPPPSVDW